MNYSPKAHAILCACLSLMVSFTASHAFAGNDYETTAEMHEACTDLMQVSLGKNSSDPKAVVAAVWCRASMEGYINGAGLTSRLYVEAYRMLASTQNDKIQDWEKVASKSASDFAGLCLPPRTGSEDVARVFVAYVNRNRDELSRPWIGTLKHALDQSFPCR